MCRVHIDRDSGRSNVEVRLSNEVNQTTLYDDSKWPIRQFMLTRKDFKICNNRIQCVMNLLMSDPCRHISSLWTDIQTPDIVEVGIGS